MAEIKFNRTAIFTISSINYISFVRTLFDSIRSLHFNEIDLYLVLVDEVDDKIDLSNEIFTTIEAKDLAIADFNKMVYKYDIMEMNTAVKPFFIKRLLNQCYEKVIYLDPDILVLERLDYILDLLNSYSIILTPHITTPINDLLRPSEQDFLKNGIYNLGFIALSNTQDAHKLSDWWSLRCELECYNEPETGYFVDQKWINYAPSLFESVYILRHVGFNMAYWNLHERSLDNYIVNNDAKLHFFHFSGIDFDSINIISRYQNRYTLHDRPDLVELFEIYKIKIMSNGFNKTKNIPYKYACYENGERIGPFARRLYIHYLDKFDNPFSVEEHSYYSMLKSRNLLEKSLLKKLDSEQLLNKSNKIHFMLNLIRVILGINRYVLLMRYLRWISVIRRQQFLLD